MRALFDVNLLLSLFDDKHVHHAKARQWWTSEKAHGWATSPITENGFLRVCSQRSYSNPKRLADALRLLQSWAKPPSHAFWADDLSLIDSSHIDHSRLLGPKQITDIYLLALAVKHGGRLVTMDRSVSVAAVKGARPENLVQV